MTRGRLFTLAFVTCTLVLIADQISKHMMLDMLLEHSVIEVTSFFNLALVWNQGISFGMLAEHNKPLILVGVSAIIIAILLIWLNKNTLPVIAFSLGAIIGGAIGNVIDRLRFGAVFDFLDFHIAGLHWPAFNIADSAIFIGVVLLCLHSMFTKRQNTLGE